MKHKFTIFLMGLIFTIALVGCSNNSTETATEAEATIAKEETEAETTIAKEEAEVVAETEDEKSAKIQYNLEVAILKIGQGMDKQLEETEFSDILSDLEEVIFRLNSGVKYYEVAKGYLLEAYVACGDISKYSKLKEDIYECYLNISTLTTEIDGWEVMNNPEILTFYKNGLEYLLIQRTVLYVDLLSLFDSDLEY
ncbi:MAG: hypothetical protein NC223_02535 [Butyrivibrio sp.]|nr:hypothetical protein [Butyrivibrio sp.]